MKKFFNKIGNAVKKGGAMINIPLIKEEKRKVQEEIQSLNEEYSQRKRLRENHADILKDIDTLIRSNRNSITKFDTKNFDNKTDLIDIIERTNIQLLAEKQKIELVVNFDDNEYTERITELETKLTKLHEDLMKCRGIVKK